MEPEIKILSKKKLIGKHIKMSHADNRTPELWKSFMPVKKSIRNHISNELISMQVYNRPLDITTFNPHLIFEKRAAVEVSSFDEIPDGMEQYTLQGGLYAVFVHKGTELTAHLTFNYIFTNWFPSSGYDIDNREHFEILGEKYKNGDPDSEEEIWIPIKRKSNINP